MDAATFGFLLTPPGQRLLSAAMSSYDDSQPLRTTERLRRLDGGYPAEQVAAALTQVALRRAGAGKFGAQAAGMYFTAAGLEQATHPRVARHRAGRVRAGGAGRLLDLGCGIGADLVAFAREGFDVTGVDTDRLTASVAAANLEALGLHGEIVTAAAEAVGRQGFDVVFADPSRRSGTARTLDPRAFSPPWEFVASLLDAAAGGLAEGQRAVAKLAPGLDHALIPSPVEAEWVSLSGDLKEVALWSPAPTGVRRRASVLHADGRVSACSDESPLVGRPPVAGVGSFLYEPDPAVIRAHLVSVVVDEVAGWLLDPHLAYVSSDTHVSTGLARCFRVVEVLPFKEKPLRAALRARGIGNLTIKKRGVAVTPEDLRRRLALRGDERATLVLTRTPRSATALLVEPLV